MIRAVIAFLGYMESEGLWHDTKGTGDNTALTTNTMECCPLDYALLISDQGIMGATIYAESILALSAGHREVHPILKISNINPRFAKMGITCCLT